MVLPGVEESVKISRGNMHTGHARCRSFVKKLTCQKCSKEYWVKVCELENTRGKIGFWKRPRFEANSQICVWARAQCTMKRKCQHWSGFPSSDQSDGQLQSQPSAVLSFSAAPQQSEICVKFSVFHTVFDVKFW